MEILSSRVLLRPKDFERSHEFYSRLLGLHIYREWGSGSSRGVVFFLGGGFLELSGRSDADPGDRLRIWLQVRDVEMAFRELSSADVGIVEEPSLKPWGLAEMTIVDPDGVLLVLVEVPPDHPLRLRTG